MDLQGRRCSEFLDLSFTPNSQMHRLGRMMVIFLRVTLARPSISVPGRPSSLGFHGHFVSHLTQISIELWCKLVEQVSDLNLKIFFSELVIIFLFNFKFDELFFLNCLFAYTLCRSLMNYPMGNNLVNAVECVLYICMLCFGN